jgi:hypothetical protein
MLWGTEGFLIQFSLAFVLIIFSPLSDPQPTLHTIRCGRDPLLPVWSFRGTFVQRLLSQELR